MEYHQARRERSSGPLSAKKGRCRGWSRQRPLPGMEKSGNDNRIRSTVARRRDLEPDAEGGRGDREPKMTHAAAVKEGSAAACVVEPGSG